VALHPPNTTEPTGQAQLSVQALNFASTILFGLRWGCRKARTPSSVCPLALIRVWLTTWQQTVPSASMRPLRVPRNGRT